MSTQKIIDNFFFFFEFVPTGNKSGYFIDLFLYLKINWLVESKIQDLRNRFLPSIEYLQEHII